MAQPYTSMFSFKKQVFCGFFNTFFSPETLGITSIVCSALQEDCC